MPITRLLIAALVAGLCAVLSGDLVAQDHASERRARVSARPLEDGRIEFALQLESDPIDMMEGDASASPTSWDERILPRGRNFPADPTSGGWLSSNPSILVGEVETRIRARRLEDGRTEFVVQQRTDGENWGEHILPSSRYLSTSHRISHVDRWLNSSVVTLSTVIVTPTVVVPAGVPIVAEAVLAWAELDGWTSNGSEPSFYYGVRQDPLNDSWTTYVVKVARTDDELYETIRLQISCLAGAPWFGLWEDSLPYFNADLVDVQYRFDDGEVISDYWFYYSDNTDGVFPPDPWGFAEELRAANRFVIRMHFYSRIVTASFDKVSQMFDTKVQPNVEYCGHY